MKAVIVRAFAPVDQAEYSDFPDPSPAPLEVVVDLAAIDVNYPDILYFEGRYQNKPALPFVPGLAAAGWISALGKGVQGLMIGQRVLVLPRHGTYAQKAALPADFCFRIPDAMPFDVAAAFGLVYQTTWFALMDRGRFAPGDRVLVLGATGGVGAAVVQLAKALGAGMVIAATRRPDQMAQDLGADVVINSGMDNLRDGLRDAVMAATGGHGADIVIDPVGGDLSAAALRAMAWSGRLVVVGFAAGAIPQFSGNYLLVRNISVSGLQWTDYRTRQLGLVHQAQDQIFDLWSQGKLHPRIARTLPLARFAEALADLAAARATGKIILIPPTDTGLTS